METEIICPLGSKCEEATGGKVLRCAWYIKLVGKDPQSEKEYDEWRCAMAWLPTMLVEVSQTNRGQTKTIGKFRDVVANGINGAIAMAQQRKEIKYKEQP